MASNTYLIDSGYARSGVYWEVHKYKLRYAVLYETRVNGKATQFRSAKQCYNHLRDTKVTNFERAVVDGKEVYNQVMDQQEAQDAPMDERQGSGDGVGSPTGSDGGLL